MTELALEEHNSTTSLKRCLIDKAFPRDEFEIFSSIQDFPVNKNFRFHELDLIIFNKARQTVLRAKSTLFFPERKY